MMASAELSSEIDGDADRCRTTPGSAGTNENTNGLLRQYLPRGTSLESLPQSRCDAIAEILNTRPRKRHAYKTPKTCFHVALQS